MRCPKCHRAGYVLTEACPACGFHGDAALVEELSHIHFLLEELAKWEQVRLWSKEVLRQEYRARQRQIEVALGLREPPLDAADARAARREIAQLSTLLEVLPSWVGRGWLTRERGAAWAKKIRAEIKRLNERLIDAPPVPRVHLTTLAKVRFLAETLDELHDAGHLANQVVYERARGQLNAEIEELEIAAGLRPAPKEAAPPPPEPPPPAPATPPPARRRPRQPLTWDRVWETMLSERTLRALLFIGVALLFAAAVSLVVWNWDAFAPWLQVTFLTLFTGIFYVLGWYVRQKMGLRGSGIALSAVASLLVPLDFYAFYLSGGFPPDRWAEVWLTASLVSLGAYLVTVYVIQAAFFGYLVGVATGSALCAGLQMGGVALEWWQAALMGLALVLVISGDMLRQRQGRWRIVADPLGHVALAAAGAILAVSSSWALLGRAGGRPFETALAIDWWLAGPLFVLAERRFRTQVVGLAAPACFPLAVWLSQRVLFDLWGVEAAWHALGWALLVPIYLIAGRGLLREEVGRLGQRYGRVIVGWAGALTALAAGWSLTEGSVAAIVHPLLAGAIALAVTLWRRPMLSLLSSLLLLTGTGAWMASREATVGQLGLAWALLAIVHVVVGLRLEHAGAREETGSDTPPDQGETALRPYDGPVYLAGWAIALLALLPPLVTFDRPKVTYTLGNFAAVNAWLALLLHQERAGGFRRLLAARRLRPIVFHWMAAAALLPWVWLVWIGRRPVQAQLGLAYLLLAYLLLGLGTLLRRARWPYGRPWHSAAHAANVVAIALSLIYYQQHWTALIVLLGACFYFASARLLYQGRWLALGGWLFPIGWALGLDWLGLSRDLWGVMTALVVLGYVVVARFLERYRGVRRAFLLPLYNIAQVVAVLVFAGILGLAGHPEHTDATLLWGAVGQVLLGIAFGLVAWFFGDQRQGHVAAWLGVVGGGLAAIAYSQGRGSSAAKAALLAVLYVLAERGLLWAARQRKRPPPWRAFFRRAWRLYRRPLLVAGWLVSIGAIGLALLRNLLLLGGGRQRETWAIVGLLLITGLYALAAWLFRRQRYAIRFVWFAGILLFAPWTLLAHQGWYVRGAPTVPAYAVHWAILALIEWSIGAIGGKRTAPLRTIAHLLLPLSLLWGIADVATSSITFGLGALFYLLAAGWDHRRRSTSEASDRGEQHSPPLYPAAALVPVWAVYLLARFAPTAPETTYGWLLLGFTLPMLALGRWLAGRQRPYGLPLYLTAYGTAIMGTMLMLPDRPALIIALLFDTVVAAISTWTFREPLWTYPAAATLPTALVLSLAEWGVDLSRRGWGLIALGGAYLLAAWILRTSSKRRGRAGLSRYATPIVVTGLLLIALGLPPSSQDRLGAMVGYGAAALLYTLVAIWLQQPLLLSAATGLALVPYGVGIRELEIASVNYGLALWPGIIAALLIAHGLDWRWGVLQEGGGERPRSIRAATAPLPPFRRAEPAGWPRALGARLTRWWALPLYTAAYAGAAVSAILSLQDPARLAWTLLWAAIVYGLAAYRFVLRSWMVLAVTAAQLAALAAIRWLGWWDRPAQVALAFAPVTWTTALAARIVQRCNGEHPPLGRREQIPWHAWSSPLYALLLVDLAIGQSAALHLSGESAWVSLSHALLLALLATAWISPGLIYAALLLGLGTLIQRLFWVDVDVLVWPWAWALLGVGYGLPGYLLVLLRRRADLPERAQIWSRPLRLGGWIVTGYSLLMMIATGLDVAALTVRAAFGRPLITEADLPQVQMVVSVLAIVGLFYLAAAVVDRVRWLGYAAVGLLLGAWSLEWLLVWGMREVQWYAIPAGLYLLGVGYLEWRQGSRPLARWIDRLALLLLLGSAFWQSLSQEPGWAYALLMGVEGLLIVWWGSARRLRRFLYVGVAGVMVDLVAQLIEPLLSANRWIVFGVAGLLIIGLGILIERRLEQVRALSESWRKRLEAWE